MTQKMLKLLLLVSSMMPMGVSAEECTNDICADDTEICITEETYDDVLRKKVRCLKVCGPLQVCGTTTLSDLYVRGNEKIDGNLAAQNIIVSGNMLVDGGPVIGIQYAYFYNDVPFGVGAGAEIPLGEQLFGLGIKKHGDEYATVSLPGLYEVYFNLFSTTDNEMVTVLVNDVPAEGGVYKSSGSGATWSTLGVEYLSLKPGDWTSFRTTAPITAGTFSFSIKRIAPSV